MFVFVHFGNCMLPSFLIKTKHKVEMDVEMYRHLVKNHSIRFVCSKREPKDLCQDTIFDIM